MNWYPEQEITANMRAAYREFLDERPERVRRVAERFDPWTMYRLTTTGQRCQVIGFHETESDDVTVYIYAEHEVLGPISGVQVFGIDPDTLVPWDGAERPEWIVQETRGGEVVGGSLRVGDGVSYRVEREDVPHGGWKSFEVEVGSIEDGRITLRRKSPP